MTATTTTTAPSTPNSHSSRSSAETLPGIELEKTHDPATDIDAILPRSPRTFPAWRKWACVLTLCTAALCVTCSSSIYTSTYAHLTEEWGTPLLLNVAGLSLFVLGMGVGPMFLSPLSEFYGRRPVYLGSFGGFALLLLPCGLAPNIAVMLVFRFLSGTAGSAFLSVAGGSVGDMFSGAELSMPMMLFTVSPFAGPVLGPLIGGWIVGTGVWWRWTLWTVNIWAAVECCLIFLLVPETYWPVLTKKAEGTAKVHISVVLRTVVMSCKRPMMLLLLEPMLLCLCCFTAVLLGILYLFFQAFPLVFGGEHGMNQQTTGMMFLGLLVGMSICTASDPIWKMVYQKLVKRSGSAQPEYRLPCGIVGGVVIPMGLFIFAWTGREDVHWIAPVIGASMFAGGTVLVFQAVFTFLVEAYPLYAASALAANSFTRSCFAACFPLFSNALYEGLGIAKAGTVLACLCVPMAPVMLSFFIWGPKLRARSRFTEDK